MQLINDRTHKPVADAVEIAVTRKARRRGLLGRDGLDETAALMITRCFSIHTFFMRFAIDVVFLDRDGCVVRMVPRMRPGHMAMSWRARTVIELAAGRLERCSVEVGDRLYLAPPREYRRAS